MIENMVKAFDQLRALPLFIWWDQWIPDKSWAAYLSGKEGILCPITHDEFNYALKQTQLYQTILYSDSQNHIGIYYQKQKVKSRMVSFY